MHKTYSFWHFCETWPPPLPIKSHPKWTFPATLQLHYLIKPWKDGENCNKQMCVTSKNTLEIAHRPCYSRFTTSGCLCIVDEFALQSFFCFSGKKQNKQKKKKQLNPDALFQSSDWLSTYTYPSFNTTGVWCRLPHFYSWASKGFSLVKQ